MNRSTRILFSLLLGFAASVQATDGVGAAERHIAHEPASAVPETPARAQRFETDLALRQGMGRIHASVSQYQHGKPTPAQAVLLATSVEKDVSFIFANCKLEPAADHALHGVLAKLLQGAAALKADPANQAPVLTMRAALADYARLFADKTFVPLPD